MTTAANSRELVPILAVLRPKTVERFRAKLRPEGDCMVWTGSKNRAGYGFVDVTYQRKAVRFSILTHRLAWALAAQRDPPAGKVVCHRCNNPSCCKSAHLYLDTAQDNSDDMVRAGRQARPLKGIMGTSHPASKYTDAQKAQVVDLIAGGGNIAQAARSLGCTHQTASRWWNEFEALCGRIGREAARREWGIA